MRAFDLSAARAKHGFRLCVADQLALLVLAIVAAVAAASFDDYGLGWDDFTHAQYGELLLALYGSGFTDTRALSFVNLFMYGGGFDMAAALLAKLSPLSLFEARRFTGAALGIAGLFAAWRLGRRVGGANAGLLALVLLVSCPLYYGHMFMNAKDAPFAVFVIIALLGSARAFEEYPKPTPASLLLIGIGFGLVIGSRVVGVIAGVFAAAGLAVIFAAEVRRRGAKPATLALLGFLAALGPALVLGYAVAALVWPWGVLHPLNPIRALQYFSVFFEKPWKELFDGALVAVPEMPRSYVPTLFALKLPELFLALGLSGIAGAFVFAIRSSEPVHRRAILMMLAVAVALPIAMTIITRPAMYNGIRHFIFVLPPLAILAGWAGASIYALAAKQGPLVKTACALAIVAGLATPIIEMVRLHPYQYTHFNQLAGGIRGADDRYMLDYWGLAFKEASEALRARLTESLEVPGQSRRWQIAVCGPHPGASIELGPEFRLTWDAKGADFALMLGEFYCAELKAPVIVEVEREGVVYARVYDIRGRHIPSLFTIAPP